MNPRKIAILASGSGTNAEAIMKYFRKNPSIQVQFVLSNNPEAKVLERADKFNVSTFKFNRDQFYNSLEIPELLNKNRIDLVVLAGFMWLVPRNFIEYFNGKIINIHPALLPQYGGKGMYGSNVHEAVIEAGETQSGITIHFVNENYDEGEIIKQDSCKVEKNDTAKSLSKKINELEYSNYPVVIEEYLRSL